MERTAAIILRSTFTIQLQNEKREVDGRKAGSFFHMAIRSIRDIKAAQDTINASLASFTHAITLCAKARGLDTCIQFSNNHVYPWVRKDWALAKGRNYLALC